MELALKDLVTIPKNRCEISQCSNPYHQMESTPLSRMKASRRFHHKSRAGCRQCRGRKTKCDEEKPRCQKCVARGLVCSFVESSLVIIPAHPHLTISWTPSEATLAKQAHHSPNTTVEDQVVEAPCLEVQLSIPPVVKLVGNDSDILRLMHHYTMHTCLIISNSAEMLPLWQTFVPQLAFNHEFLLHGVLAVAALHLNITDPTTEHANAALQHYTKALALFRPHVANVTAENALALFALSCLLPLYSFGVKATSLSPVDSISEITEVFTLMRGIRTIVAAQSGWLKASPFAYVLAVVSEDIDCALPEDTEKSLALLLSRSKMITSLVYRDIFEKSILVLRGTLAHAQDVTYNRMLVAPFPLKVPEEFIEAVRERHPIALVILAHYGVVLYQLRKEVWLTGWGSRIVDAVKYSLGEEWAECMAWPIQQTSKL